MLRRHSEPKNYMRRATCPLCGQTVPVLVPKGGDGSVDVFRRHKNYDGTPCDRSRTEVPAECY